MSSSKLFWAATDFSLLLLTIPLSSITHSLLLLPASLNNKQICKQNHSVRLISELYCTSLIAADRIWINKWPVELSVNGPISRTIHQSISEQF